MATSVSRGKTVSTGIEGLDALLRGGLPAGNIYLVHGSPGTGKTTLALQFLRQGVATGERVLYVALGETASELRTVAASHGWSLDGIDICDLHGTEPVMPAAQYTFFHPAEFELGEATKTVLGCVDRVKPDRIVLDSVSEMRMLARDSLRYRRQILTLKHFMAEQGSTVLLLDTLPALDAEFQLRTVAHGVLTLQQRDPAYGGKRRRLCFEKVRGVPFRDGWHDYAIETGGVRVFPRLASGEDGAPGRTLERISSGNRDLDALLGGGLDRGSSTLFVGPAGVGKSTLATHVVNAALGRGERVAVHLFDESPRMWFLRAAALGATLGGADERLLSVEGINPAELSPGELAHRIRRQVEEWGARMVVIDSINGYNEAMPEEHFLGLHMHELLSYLGQREVSTLLVLATVGTSSGPAETPLDLSYISDSIVVLRYFEAFGHVRKAISVLKKRSGAHEHTIRELEIVPRAGIRVGPELREFRGILTSAPEYAGDRAHLFGDHDRRQR
jgi:circadian clock protein KaiC